MTSAAQWISDNREWLFSGVGLIVLSAVWRAFRRFSSKRNKPSTKKVGSKNKQTPSSFGEDKPESNEIKPLMVRTTDGYLAQIGVLFEWRIVDPIPFMTNLGDEAQAGRKITERLRYHLIEGLEQKALSEIREERAATGSQLLQTFRKEISPFGVELVHLKIGRVTPVDRHE